MRVPFSSDTDMLDLGGGSAAYRWGGIAHDGKWAVQFSFHGVYSHIHAQCVVDDFGNLTPVGFAGMTADGHIVECGVYQ